MEFTLDGDGTVFHAEVGDAGRLNRQVKSFFMRDFYGKVTKPDWFG